MQLLLTFLVTFTLVFSEDQERPTIKLQAGEIRGHYKQSHHGHTFAAFEGIPYAKPPLGELRFAEPQPAEPWDGVRDTTVTYTCMQLGWMINNVIGNEDCLYLNVYVPREKPVPNENLDVIVHIHGGAFMIGNPEMAGPEFLMDKDIIYVNLNYRLGVLGFLSTEDDVVPGNNGMKDQVLALKWVQENIALFGGNPNSVTITGMSAGGAAVHLHYFSPLSKGLFHRGMSQSGVATAPWVVQKAPLQRTKQIAATVGCDDSSTHQIVACLRQRSATQIVNGLKKLQVLPSVPLAPFSPVIEKESNSAFLTDYPFRMLNNGDVRDLPWLTTIASDEGILGLMFVGRILDKVDSNWNQLAPVLLEYDVAISDSDKLTISQKLKEFYFNNEKLSPEVLPKFIKLYGDRLFNFDFETCARLQSKVNKSPVYAYIYGYQTTSNKAILKQLTGIDKDYGVSHAEDGGLIYTVKFNGLLLTPEHLPENDQSINNLLLGIVTSFARNGRPEIEGISWKPTSNAGDFGFLSIKGPKDVGMVYEDEIAPKEFWKSLPLVEYENFKFKRDEL